MRRERPTRRLRVPAVVPSLISTDVSSTRPPVAPKRPPRPWELKAEAQQEQATEAMAIFHQIVTSLGGILNFEKASAAGDVMGQIAVTIGSSGMWNHQWANSYAALTVANLSPALLTVTSLVPMTQAPTVGTGVTRVRGGVQRTFASRANVVTVYGAPGAQFDITVYGRPRDPQTSRCVSGVFTRLLESQKALAANATFNGATLDCGAGVTRFRGFASSDQAGTLNMQQSPDGVTWFTTQTEPVAAGYTVGTVVESITAMRYVRVQYVNGATLQTEFTLASSAVED